MIKTFQLKENVRLEKNTKQNATVHCMQETYLEHNDT